MLVRIISLVIIVALNATGIVLTILFFQSFSDVKKVVDLFSLNGSKSFTELYFQNNIIFYKAIALTLSVIGLIFFLIRKSLEVLVSHFLIDLKTKIIAFKKYINKFFTEKLNTHYISLCIIIYIGIVNRLLHLNYPLRYDEAFTYYSYVKTSFLHAIANYSYPNNHIFHTILVKVSTFFLGDSLVAIRFPTLISGILILPFSYYFIKKIYDRHIGLISTSILACCFPLIEYSANARGYSIICLLFLLLLIIGLKKNKSISEKFFIILISSFGFYTIPVFIYPFIIFLFWIILSNSKDTIKDVIIYLMGTASISIILYSPVLLYTGIESLIRNDFIKSYDYKKLWEIFTVTFKSFTNWVVSGYRYISIFILIIGSIIGTLRGKKSNNLLFLCLLLGLIIPIIILRVVPPERVLIFTIPILIPFALSGIFKGLKNEKIVVLTSLFTAIFFSINIHLNRAEISKDRAFLKYDKLANELKDVISPGDRLIASIPVDYPLEYYLKKYNIPFSFEHVNNGGFPSLKKKFKNTFVIIDNNYNNGPFELYSKQNISFILILKEANIEVYKII